jgi:hypothetical protein
VTARRSDAAAADSAVRGTDCRCASRSVVPATHVSGTSTDAEGDPRIVFPSDSQDVTDGGQELCGRGAQSRRDAYSWESSCWGHVAAAPERSVRVSESNNMGDRRPRHADFSLHRANSAESALTQTATFLLTPGTVLSTYSLLTDITRAPAVLIRDSFFGNNRARGVLVKTSNAIITGSTFGPDHRAVCAGLSRWVRTQTVFTVAFSRVRRRDSCGRRGR